MGGRWLFRPLLLRERVGRGLAPVSSTLRTRDRKGPPTLWHQRQLVEDPLAPVLDGRLVAIRKKPVPEGPAQTMASPQAVAAFRVQALERSRFAVGRLPAAYGDWSARPLGCRCEVNGVKWPWNSLAELTTRPVSAPRPSIAVALDDRAAVGTRDFPSSPPMGDSFWLGL